MNGAQHRLALPAGYELGRYRFQSVLGSGGFGITYLAEDTTLRRRVAVKELLPNDIATRIDGTTVVAKTESEEESLTWARERFVGEGRALAACDHPNIVNVYEMVEANGTAYMVTKYEEGQSLEQWLRGLGRSPNESELRSILTPLLSGLETVHQAGFLHRDIKPENIYLTKNGRPVLLDFGSARQAITSRSTALTSIVTSGYAPFEQYHEDGNQGPWSDIYALAAVMYRAITGKKPPEATRRLKDDPIEKLSARYAGQYDAEFLRAIDRALAVNENKRPQSVAEWQKMLGAGDRLPIDSDQTRLAPRSRKPSDWKTFFESHWTRLLQSPRALLIGSGVGLIVLLGLIWAIAHPRSATDSHHSAAIESPPPAPQPTAAPQPTSSAEPTAVVNVSPSPSAATSATPAVLQMDPQLIGTWETKARLPSRPSRFQTVRWEQSEDGHYVFSGGISDAGAISAADGKMQLFSNNATQPVDVSYQFNGETLVTNGPLGSTVWHRSKSKSSQADHRSNHQNTRRERVMRSDDVERAIINHFFRRYP